MSLGKRVQQRNCKAGVRHTGTNSGYGCACPYTSFSEGVRYHDLREPCRDLTLLSWCGGWGNLVAFAKRVKQYVKFLGLSLKSWMNMSENPEFLKHSYNSQHVGF